MTPLSNFSLKCFRSAAADLGGLCDDSFALSRVYRFSRVREKILLFVCMCICLVFYMMAGWLATQGANGAIPVGGDGEADDGGDAVQRQAFEGAQGVPGAGRSATRAQVLDLFCFPPINILPPPDAHARTNMSTNTKAKNVRLMFQNVRRANIIEYFIFFSPLFFFRDQS